MSTKVEEPYGLAARTWVTMHGKPVLGTGRAALLKAIDEYGSIAQAARHLGMSYKKAWGLVESMNTGARTPLVSTASGGKGGGGTALTDEGRRLLVTFNLIQTDIASWLDNQAKSRLNPERG